MFYYKMKIGDKAPNFKLKDKNNKEVSLDEVKSDFTILYFYPKDSTPGCTIQAREFSILKNEFKKSNTEIIGISGGDNKSKEKFCLKNNLEIALLSDSDFNVCKKFGVYGQKSFMGKSFFGIKRTTFILDKDKKIVKIFENVKARGHAKEILSAILILKK